MDARASRAPCSSAADSDARLLDAVRAAAARAQSAQRQVMQLQAYADNKVTDLQAAVQAERRLRPRAEAEATILILSLRELEASFSSHLQGSRAQNKSLLRQAQALRTVLSHSSRQQQEQIRESGALQARLTQLQADKEQLFERCARLEAQRDALIREVRERSAHRPAAISSPSCRRQAWQVHDSRARAGYMTQEALQTGSGRASVQMAIPPAAHAQQSWGAEVGCTGQDKERDRERRRPLVTTQVEVLPVCAERAERGLTTVHKASAAFAVTAGTASDGRRLGKPSEKTRALPASRWRHWARELQRSVAVRALRAQQARAAAVDSTRAPAARGQTSLLWGGQNALPVLGEHNRDLPAGGQVSSGPGKASARREVQASGGNGSTPARRRRPGRETEGVEDIFEAGSGWCGKGAAPGGVQGGGNRLGMRGEAVEQGARDAASEAVREAAAGCSAWSAEVDALTLQLARVESSLIRQQQHPAHPSWMSGSAAPPPARSGVIDAAFTCVEAEIEQLQLALALATQYAEYTPVMQAQIARFSVGALAEGCSSDAAEELSIHACGTR